MKLKNIDIFLPWIALFIYFIKLLNYNNISIKKHQTKIMQKIGRKMHIEESFQRKWENIQSEFKGVSSSGKNGKLECSSCAKVKRFIYGLKKQINDLQQEKTQFLCEVELNLFHFSYIVELISKNIWNKHEALIENLKQKQIKSIGDQINEQETRLLQIIVTQKNQLDALKQRTLELESENENFKESIKQSIQTGSSLSFSLCDESYDELPSFGPVKENKKSVEGSISLPLLSGGRKQQSISELRERLNKIRHRISRISESEVFCSDF